MRACGLADKRKEGKKGKKQFRTSPWVDVLFQMEAGRQRRNIQKEDGNTY